MKLALIAGILLSLPSAVLAQEKSDSAKDQKPAAEPAKKKELDVAKMPFDAESVRQVVMFHMSEIQECYERVLSETGEKIEGRVVLSFVVDTNGNVGEAKVVPKKSTLKDERVLDCVLAMRAWYFPRPNDNRDHPIEYPFDLKVKH